MITNSPSIIWIVCVNNRNFVARTHWNIRFMPRTHAIEAIVAAALPRGGKGFMSGNKAHSALHSISFHASSRLTPAGSNRSCAWR